MTPTELASLEALAKAATPGPWYVVTKEQWEAGFDFFAPPMMSYVFSADVDHEDAAFIAAANPAALLSLIEENKGMREALTPSGETKAAYLGEFSFMISDWSEGGEEIARRITVPWTTIKEIMAAIRARAALEPQS